MSVLARFARTILRAALGRAPSADGVLGDLEEEYRAAAAGPRRELGYAWHALRLAVGYGLWRRMRRRSAASPAAIRLPGAGLWLDVRYAARSLVRRPAYLVAGVATLALGIGADTAIFSVVWHSLLRPLPFAHADRVLMLYDRPLDRPAARSNMNIAAFLELRERSRAFDAMSAFEYSNFLLAGGGEPAQVLGMRVNAGFFGLIGLAPRLGRDFTPEDDEPGAPAVVILSDRLWRDRFGADPAIVGRTIRVDLRPYVVVGVAAPEMSWPASPQMWVPWAWDSATRSDHRRRSIFAVGRIAENVAADAARAELASLFAEIRARYPDVNENRTIDGEDLTEWMVGWGRRFMLILSVAAALVLVVACVNVANLMLARAAGRRAEIAMRRALGASRLQAGRVFLSEALVLACLGALGGVAIAYGGVHLIVALWGSSIPRAADVSLNGAAFAFAAFTSFGIAVLVGLVPSLVVDASAPAAPLRSAGRGAVGRGDRVQSGLVVVEIALGFVLVAAAGLLVNTAVRLGRVDLGVDPEQAVAFRLSLPSIRYDDAAAAAFFATLVRELQALPSVAAVGLATRDPLDGGTNGDFATALDPERTHLLEMRSVTPGWFDAIGQPLLRGRMLEPADGRPGATAIVVNAALARELFPQNGAIGQEIRDTDGERAWTIVGVVADVRDMGPMRDPRPTVYWPYGGDVLTGRSMAILVRTAGADIAAVLPVIRERVHALDADLPITDVATLQSLAARTIGRERRATLALVGAFAALALMLALLGLYAVIAFVVEERRREVGVRVALGATKSGILRLVCMRGLRLAGLGVAVGALGAILSGRLIAHLLWQVRPADPVTLGATALLFCGVAVLASALPARRAASFEVADVLRGD